jgi:hypothetical protein
MKNLLLIIALIVSAGVFAQPDDRGPKHDRKDRIKAHKIAFISSELELTPKEAEKFWPVYNECEAKVDKVRKERRGYLKKLKGLEELSDEDAFNLMEKVFDTESSESALRKEYLGKFAAVIGKKKAAKVFIAEEKFKRELLKKIKKGNHGPQHEGPPGHGPNSEF